MPKKSQINIFKVLSEEELTQAIEKENNKVNRYYQRLIAMSLIQHGINHNQVAEVLHVSYQTVWRWAKSCEQMGLDGLEFHFNGGKASLFTPKERKKFITLLKRKKVVTIKDAQRILSEVFFHDFSIGYVGELVRDLGFEYNTDYLLSKEKQGDQKTLIYIDDYVL